MRVTRAEAIHVVKLALLREPDPGLRVTELTALQRLLRDLETAEELLDLFYDDLVEKAGERKPELDRLVFSRRAERSG